MKTLVYSIHGFDQSFLEEQATDKLELTFTKQPLHETTVALAKEFEAVVLFTSDIASAAVLEKLQAIGVKYVALRSAGYDHVDLTKATALGMKVANVPNYSPYAIAEHAVTLLLAMNRKIVLGQQLMQQNDFRLDALIGVDLHGKTVGIVGTGKTGAAFARIMHGFGCKLLGYDIAENKELILSTHLKYTSFEELCQSADVISVHCPLNEETKHLFNKRVFDQLKKGAILINTARGAIVKTADLLEALNNGTLTFAGLDVYEHEKPIFFYDHTSTPVKDELFLQLREHPRVLMTGHQAFLTHEALQGIARTTIDNLTSWSQSGSSENDLN